MRKVLIILILCILVLTCLFFLRDKAIAPANNHLSEEEINQNGEEEELPKEEYEALDMHEVSEKLNLSYMEIKKIVSPLSASILNIHINKIIEDCREIAKLEEVKKVVLEAKAFETADHFSFVFEGRIEYVDGKIKPVLEVLNYEKLLGSQVNFKSIVNQDPENMRQFQAFLKARMKELGLYEVDLDLDTKIYFLSNKMVLSYLDKEGTSYISFECSIQEVKPYMISK